MSDTHEDIGAGLPGPESVTQFDSTFGCYEMERAAECIVAKATAEGSWNVSFTMGDMGGNPLATKGLFMLALHGWLVASYPNGRAEANRSFVERLTSRQP